MKIKLGTFTKDGVTRKTSKLYARFYDHQNIRRHLPLFKDTKNAGEAALAIERLVNIRASGSDIPPELQRFIENTLPSIRDKLAEWSIIDSTRVASAKTLAEHQNEWKKFLLSQGNGANYVELKTARLEKLFKACRFVMWNDIRAATVSETLAEWRKREEGPLSVQTSNFYLQAAKQFCNFMVKIVKCDNVATFGTVQSERQDRSPSRSAGVFD